MSPSVGVCPASEPRMCGEEIEKQTESVWEENRLRGGWVTCQRSSQCQVGSEASWAAPARALYSPAQLVSVIWGCLWGEARCCAGLGRVGWRERRLRWQKGRVCSSARLGELMGAVDLKGHMVYRKRALFHATHAQSLTSWSAVSHHYKGDGYKSGLSFYLSRFHFGLKWQICTFLFGHPLLIYCDFFFIFIQALSATVPLIKVLCWQKIMIRSYYDVITISMFSAVISVSPDIFHAPAGYSLIALRSELDRFLALPVAGYNFLPFIPSTEVCRERVRSLLSMF